MIAPSWLLDRGISRPNQALVAAAEGGGQGGGRKFQLSVLGPRPFRTKVNKTCSMWSMAGLCQLKEESPHEVIKQRASSTKHC
jgi:hypothetical protein